MTLLSLILSSTVKMHYSKAALYLVLFVVAVHFMSSQRHQLYQLLDHGFILMHHSNMQRTGKTQGRRLPDTLVIQLFQLSVGYSCIPDQPDYPPSAEESALNSGKVLATVKATTHLQTQSHDYNMRQCVICEYSHMITK